MGNTPSKEQEAAWQIAFQGVSVGYGDHAVLQDLTMQLPGGKISVILGGSGCGKSTLLKHIIGLARPMAGSIILGGHRLETLTKAEYRKMRRHLGVLFQDGALLGALTVAENVALPLSEHLSLPACVVRNEALRVLRLVELEDFADFYPNELSGGMRKRAGLARAIITNPKILLCDEPTSGLDPVTAARMDALLLSLHKQFPAMTIISVSHDLASLRCLAHYVIVLGEGHLLFAGTLKELEEDPNPYLQQFLRRESGEQMQELQSAMQPQVAKALAAWRKL